MRLGAVSGRVECIGIDVRPTSNEPSEPLTTGVLRQLRLSAFVDEVREEADEEILDLAGLRLPATLSTLRKGGVGPLAVTHRSPGRPSLPLSTYERVAEIYLTESKPREKIMAEFHIGTSAASNYIRGARDRGLIAPTTRGRRSGAPLPPD